MAIIQYTGIINQIRGKLNGSVFNRSRNAYTLQRKQQPTRAVRGLQSDRRNAFSFIQRSWAGLSTVQKSAWAQAAVDNPTTDRFGEPTILSGYNQFIKANLFRQSAGLGVLASPAVGTAPGVSGLDTFTARRDWSISSAGTPVVTWEVVVTLTGARSGLYIIADIGLPVSNGVTNYYGTYHQVGADISTGTSLREFVRDLGRVYPLPVDGQAMFERIRVVDIERGAVVAEVVNLSSAYV